MNLIPLQGVLGSLLQEMNPLEMEAILNVSKKYPNLNDVPREKILKEFADAGIDVLELQRKAQVRRSEKMSEAKAKKVGNNEKCPCGSGKKWKKCCKV